MAEASSIQDMSLAVRESDRFLELFTNYGPAVYSTCLRITSSHHDAEDLTQQYFLDLLSRDRDVSKSGWASLRVAALRRAADHVRSELARRERHKQLARTSDMAAPVPTLWDEIAPHIDEAIEELPEFLREPIIMHYLLPLPQTEVARELHVTRLTIARRIRKGLGQLKGRLKKKAGIAVSVTALATILTDNAVQAAPATLARELGKMALFMGIQSTGEGVSVAPAEWQTSVSKGTPQPTPTVGSAANVSTRKWVRFSIVGSVALVAFLSVWSTGWRREYSSVTALGPVVVSTTPSSIVTPPRSSHVHIPEQKPAFPAPKNEKAGTSDDGAQFGAESGDYYAADPSFVQRDRRQLPPGTRRSDAREDRP